MRVLIERPYLALVPTILFLAGYWIARPEARRILLVGAVAWAAYAGYETYMFFWSKTVIAPIRVDLLLLGPVLYLITGAGLLGWWRHGRRRSGASGA